MAIYRLARIGLVVCMIAAPCGLGPLRAIGALHADEESAAADDGIEQSEEESPENPWEDRPKTLFQWSRSQEEDEGEEPEAEEPLQTDRPDFTEASTTVGRGRAQLEFG